MYTVEKNGEERDIVITGFEQGIAPSPHKGIANIQNANLSTEMNEVICSFSRVQDTMTSSATGTGNLTFVDSSHVGLSIAGSNNLFKGNWVTVSASSNTGQLPNGTYYVNPSTGSNFQLSTWYNTLTDSGSLPVTANYLVVGGGGGGGQGIATDNTGGGGGGGGQVKSGTVALNVGTNSITVGTSVAQGTNGNSTTAFSVTSAGGLLGVDSGGSTGGHGGASGSGNAGGTTVSTPGGGGGGNGSIGSNPGGIVGGAGGTGTSSSITGTSISYGGGGGAGGGTGGAGNGGGGAGGGTTTSGVNATANTGGGGGGGGQTSGGSNSSGGTGSAGVVIVAFPIGSLLGVTGGIISYSDTIEVHTFNTSGSLVIPAQPTSNPLTGFTTGLTATIQLVAVMGQPLASATETYRLNGVIYNRYYVLDSNGLVWVYDTQNETLYSTTDNVNWFLPDYQTGSILGASGIAVISGFLIVTANNGLFGKSVALLGNTNSQATTWVQFPDATGWQGGASQTPHFAYVGHQGALYVTDSNYILEVFPDSTLADTGVTTDNVQSFCSYTAAGTTATYSIISGTSPVTSDDKRLPVVFFTVNGGQLPAAISVGTVYYLNNNIATVQAFSAPSGGSALDLQAGAIGPQYFNTFYPVASASASSGGTPTYVLTGQRLTLPNFEVAQCIAEIGNLVVIGCRSNTIYPWNQIDNLPSSIISLPENNTVNIITVHQMAYIFTGNKGNIYITDGSVASLVTTIPDYCAGVPGTPSSYVEPHFVWGAAAYIRGKVYFSILDQTATKAGNCGGVWGFVPTQNMYIGQDVGIALHIENQNSYGTYNGLATVLIPKVNQNAIGPQYFSGWYSSVSSPLYGIDASGTGTNASFATILETDLIPTGTLFGKKTFKEAEYKLSSPLDTNATVVVNYRLNATDAWATLGTLQAEANGLSGVTSGGVPFEKTQWLQLQVVLTPITSSTSSFIRLSELRIR